MATRMQQRRGTASQWVSSNNGDGPILNAGEIGWESDTNKFKIGDGVNYWADLVYFADVDDIIGASLGGYVETTDIGAISGVAGLDSSKNLLVPGTSIIIEGATDNNSETTLTVTDPTADRTITFPDATGTVVLSDGSGNVTISGDLTVSGTTTTINSTTINATTGIVFEGTTENAFETTLTVTDPTADRTITFPDATGTVQLRVTDVDDTEIGYLNGVTSSIQTQLDAKIAKSLVDAKGDILVASANDTVARLAVGTNGYLLTANSSATNGVEWAAAPVSLPSQTGNSGKYLTTNGTDASWATVSSYSAPTLGSTSIASGATVTTILGLTKVRSDVFATLDASGFEVDIETMTIMGAF